MFLQQLKHTSFRFAGIKRFVSVSSVFSASSVPKPNPGQRLFIFHILSLSHRYDHIVGLESKVRISIIDNFDLFNFSENIPEGAP